MGQWRAADPISVASRHLLANSKFAGDDVFTKWSPAQTVGIRLWTKFCDFESVGPDCVQHVGYFNPSLFRLSIVTIRYIGRQDVSACVPHRNFEQKRRWQLEYLWLLAGSSWNLLSAWAKGWMWLNDSATVTTRIFLCAPSLSQVQRSDGSCTGCQSQLLGVKRSRAMLNCAMLQCSKEGPCCTSQCYSSMAAITSRSRCEGTKERRKYVIPLNFE